MTDWPSGAAHNQLWKISAVVLFPLPAFANLPEQLAPTWVPALSG